MRKTADQCLWSKDLKLKQYPSLNQDITTDVLIIGGGVTGALTAFMFCEENIDIVLIEKGTIANQSTKASTSILHYEIDTDFIKLSSLINEKNATEAFHLTLDMVNLLDNITDKLEDKCEYIRRPSFYYTNREEEYDYLFSEYEMRKKSDFDVEFIDGKKDKDKFRFPFVAGILTYNSGAEVNPVKLANECLKYCHKRNVQIYEQTEAVEFDLEDDVKIITKNGNTIRCKKIIIASGYDGLSFFEKPFYTMTRTFVLATKPVKNFDGWFSRSLIKNTEDPYVYLRTTIDDRIIIGGEDVTVTYNTEDTLNMHDDHEMAHYKYKLLETKLENMFPLIKEKDIEFRFNGIFIDSDDGLPYFGSHDEYPNIDFNIGIGSNGLIYGLMGAKLLVNKHIGKIDPRLELFRFNR